MPEEKSHRGRKPGFTLTEEEKLNRKLKRAENKAKRAVVQPDGLPTLICTGNEESGFDFWTAIRKTLRPLHQYKLCARVEKEIVNPGHWQNLKMIHSILGMYFNVVIVPVEKKTRKKSQYVMTEEHKEKLRQARRNK